MKKGIIVSIISVIAIFGSFINVYAWNSSLTNKDFEKNTSYSIDTDSHKMNTSFVTEIKASKLAGSKKPIIRHSIQNKSLIGWSSSQSQDSTIEESNKLYQKFWTSEKNIELKQLGNKLMDMPI